MAGTDTAQERRMLNRSLAQMLKGGVIMDVTTPEQAQHRRGRRRVRRHGARAHPRRHPCRRRRVAHERSRHDQGHPGGREHPRHGQVPHRALRGGPDPPGHRASTTSTRARCSPPPTTSTTSTRTRSPCRSCAARSDLGEALRRIAEGATMIRTKGEPGTGDVVQAVRHMRLIMSQIRAVAGMADDELYEEAKRLQVPVELLREVHEDGRAPRGELRSRRRGHAGRRRPHDAAGRRGRVRGLRHLQVGRPCQARARPSCRP